MSRVLANCVDVWVAPETVLGDVRYVYRRLRRQEEQVSNDLTFDIRELHRPNRTTLREVRLNPFVDGELDGGVFLAGSRLAFGLLDRTLDTVEVSESELRVDRLEIRNRIDLSCDVDDVGVVEAPHDLSDRIRFADVMEELVAKPFALGSAFDESGDVDELHDRRDDLVRVDDVCDDGEPLVRDQCDTDVRLDGAERIVLRLDLASGERVEQRRLSDVGETDDGAANTHEDLSGGGKGRLGLLGAHQSRVACCRAPTNRPMPATSTTEPAMSQSLESSPPQL